MKGFKSLICAGFVTVVMSSCAGTPTPEEICSAEWISFRSDKAVAEFRRETRPMLRTFRKAQSDLDRGRSVNFLQMAGVLRSVEKFITKLETSRAMDDLRLLGDTCDDPKLLSAAMSDFLRQEGAPAQIVDLVENIDSYQAILRGDEPETR